MKTPIFKPLVCMIVGASLVALLPQKAEAFIGEAAVVAAVQALQKFTGTAIGNMTKNLTKTLDDNLTDMTNSGSLANILSRGINQLSNYDKAGIAASERIADASNTAMAEFLRRQQDTEIRDQHMMNPEFCTTLDAQQGIIAASKAARTSTEAIAIVSDNRGEAGPGSPSYYGKAQGVGASMALHARRYCSEDDVSAGLCSSLSRLPNADQRARSLFGQDTLSADGAVDAANDYATTVIQPVAPAALRGEQLTTTEGREAALRRRAYNGRMSLARYVLNFVTSLEIPSVPLTDAQKTEMTAEGITVADKGSWLQAMSLEANRRVSGVQWNAQIQTMPPTSVLRELAIEQAQANYLALQNYRLQLFQTTLQATTVAQREEQTFGQKLTPLPSPAITSGN
ncbi:hypothetical protein [Acetobacter sp. UBA5411]|uniref:hypothetical protein n=1 Tax=Acetobacter sp. UBA5411 TaxID=1945905 RepID=UPI0025BF43FF|nr:hypothetical protein [Acetobacter sp. UBA5411]